MTKLFSDVLLMGPDQVYMLQMENRAPIGRYIYIGINSQERIRLMRLRCSLRRAIDWFFEKLRLHLNRRCRPVHRASFPTCGR